MPRRELAADQGRHRAQLHHRLGDPAAGVLQQPGAQLLDLLRGCPRADDDALAAGAVDRLHHEFVEPVEHLLAMTGVFAAPGVDVGQDRLLRQVVADEVGQVGVDELVVGHAVTDRVGDRDIAAPCRVEQAGHAEHRITPEMNGIQEVVVDPAVDDVHRNQPVGRAHADPSGLRDQVASLHEAHPHQPRQQRVLEVRRVVGARRQHHDRRVAHTGRRTGPQGREQLGGVLRDRADAVVRERLGQPGRHRAPVRHHVRDTGRDAHIVLEHPEVTVGVADQVDAGDVHTHPRGRVDALRGAQEVRAAGDDTARDHTVVEHLTLAVDIGEECFKRPNSLCHASFHPRPCLVVDEARDDVDRERAFLTTDVEGDALVEIGVREIVGPRAQIVRRELFDLSAQLRVCRARLAAVGIHLVIGVRSRPIRLEDPCHACEPSAIVLRPCFSCEASLCDRRRRSPPEERPTFSSS